MLSGVCVGTRDVAVAGRFYDAVLATIGMRCALAEPHERGYAGADGRITLFVVHPYDGRAATVGNGTQVMFYAPDAGAVRAFHATALARGGTDEGGPGPRDYHPRYYGAYVRDPDGNKLNVSVDIHAERAGDAELVARDLSELSTEQPDTGEVDCRPDHLAGRGSRISMVTVEYPRAMSRYNRWQNRSLVRAAGTLTNPERWLDRGAFFGSIAATLNHVLWDDRVWLARLSGDSERADAMGRRHPYTDTPEDWSDYVREREQLDENIAQWARGLTRSDLEGQVEWMRGEEPMSASCGFYVVHLFNHQSHHRGQVHAMLTAAGATPEPTDLPVMP